MHSFALRLLLNQDQKRISGWLGYKRDLAQMNSHQDKAHLQQQDEWNQVEVVTNAEKVLLG